MSIFQYKAIDINGKENNGVIESDSLKSARSLLQSQNLTIIEIAKIQQKVAQTNSWMVASIKLIDISLIIRQLASLIQAAMPIDEALKTIETHSNKKDIKKILRNVHSSVVE